jgi:hypothetical protein
MPDFPEAQFEKSALSIQDTLQAVEDALIELGLGDYLVVTEHGTFRWQTIERACGDAARDSGLSS